MADHQAESEAQGDVHRGSFVERLAEKIGTSASATEVYGAPVEREGVTVIPVSKVRYGFGGGSGRKERGEEGAGGGGGVYAAPVGYIEIKDNASQYRPIRDPASMVPVIAVGGLVGIMAARTIAKLLRRR